MKKPLAVVAHNASAAAHPGSARFGANARTTPTGTANNPSPIASTGRSADAGNPNITGAPAHAGENEAGGTTSSVASKTGKAMMSGRKKCFSCGARMPEDYERGLEPGGEDSEDPLSRDMPDYVRRIFDVGQALPENARMIRPFKRAVGELRRRVTEASSRVSKMASAKIKMSPEDREKVDSIIDLSTTCMENFTKAVELLEAFEAPVDKFHMRCALELVADAVEEMRSVGGLAKKYRRAVKT